MCLYPRLIRNKKFEPNKKNGGIIPPIIDDRTLHVPIKCGKCMECMNSKRGEWAVRLMEDIKVNTNGKFVTFTFSNDEYKKLSEEIKLEGYERDNKIATLGMRRFLERWRKEFKKSVRHFMVTELGHNGTENIHLHGIIWTNEMPDTIRRIWKYGYIYPRYNTWEGNFVSEKSINYITKYITKIDEIHKTYKSIILTSAGIGNNYINTYNASRNKYNDDKTKEIYISREGYKRNLPIYWRNKIYSEEEREKLWIIKLDQNIRYVGGQKIDISKGMEEYFNALKWYRKMNIEKGFGNDKVDWELKKYEEQLRNLKHSERIAKERMKKERMAKAIAYAGG